MAASAYGGVRAWLRCVVGMHGWVHVCVLCVSAGLGEWVGSGVWVGVCEWLHGVHGCVPAGVRVDMCRGVNGSQ